uniref:Putative secreted protein n=1 Tax=Aedes albopictus TaxID=7160 RepID=A0A023EJK0_AEDAL
MATQYLLAVFTLLGLVAANDYFVYVEPSIYTTPLDCVRIRSANMQRLIYGTGYLYNTNRGRYIGVYNHHTIPHNSAFRVERIKEFKESLYYIRMINTQEFLFGGWTNTATHPDRRPVFSYVYSFNRTQGDVDVWMFEKVIKNDKFLGSWYIRNAYYGEYMIASKEHAQPPTQAGPAAQFYTIKLDRRPQPDLTIEHQFFLRIVEQANK